MSHSFVEAEGLAVKYGAYQALKSVSLSVPRGQYALLVGENGAGKSTLLRCLAGWQRPESGAIAIGGLDLEKSERQVRQGIKLVSDTPRFYAELTAAEHVQWIAKVHHFDGGDETAERLMEAFGLSANRDAFPASFSRGMQYKLGLTMALITRPDLLLLDEPFGPLDPYSQEYLAHHLSALSSSGVTVLVSTHVLPEAEPPDRLLVLEQGSIIADSTWDEVAARYPGAAVSTIPSRILKEALTSHRETHHA